MFGLLRTGFEPLRVIVFGQDFKKGTPIGL
jgi:hypothetical protein